ncbi:MAG TPA: hypothetical protein ENJ73_02675 [Desulfobacterales bacterium]|nr:hypothetical protein [Desulfobacterales bacterium]
MVWSGSSTAQPRRYPYRVPLTELFGNPPNRPCRVFPAIITLAVALLCWSPTQTLAARYATWDRYEADKLAAAWLIKRFADPAAEFVFLPAGTPPPANAIPFDIPGAALARTARTTTYTTVRHRYRLEDPVLARIGLFINDLELNVWEEKAFPESRTIANMVAGLVRQKAPPAEALATAFRFFDGLYAKLNRTMVPGR